MNRKLMEILACPIDKHFPLELVELASKEEIISEGIIFCSKCSRYYPIIEEIPIMLPDELRDKNQDIEFLSKHRNILPDKIIVKGIPWHL
ncbi:MAG: Trm112 family protein [Thaumarchaeota archaeon]|nr:Trm112 family protein [Nitrososphaerota archaeon]MDE1841828.1 Trm112 family protein [Nitrososphaerota archaeon]MDE1878238.1 Trm112 family protein [Nitrososphaerota archaeon]